MPKHPNGAVYAEHWPKIAVTLDYRGGLSYWAIVVELGGMVAPGEADAFAAVMKDAEAACELLNNMILERGRRHERVERRVIPGDTAYAEWFATTDGCADCGNVEAGETCTRHEASRPGK